MALERPRPANTADWPLAMIWPAPPSMSSSLAQDRRRAALPGSGRMGLMRTAAAAPNEMSSVTLAVASPHCCVAGLSRSSAQPLSGKMNSRGTRGWGGSVVVGGRPPLAPAPLRVRVCEHWFPMKSKLPPSKLK
jgi:hypothetical protein